MPNVHARAADLRRRIAALKSSSNPLSALPTAAALADDLTLFMLEVLDEAERLTIRLEGSTP